MNIYRNQEDGKTYDINYNICPKCKKHMHSNKYKSLEVISQYDEIDDIGISLWMLYCKKCNEMYIKYC
jgi:hypothetical protein